VEGDAEGAAQDRGGATQLWRGAWPTRRGGRRLGDLGMPEKVDEVMAALPADQRWEILKSLVPIHIKAMKARRCPMRATPATGYSAFGVRATRAAEADRRRHPDLGGNGPERRPICRGQALARKDVDRHRHPVGTMLVRLLQGSQGAYKGLAELLLKVGDEAARDQGGAALVRRAAAEKEIPNDLWIAMGTLGGQNVMDFLTQKLLKGPPAEAALAAKALQQARYPSVLPLALKIAADPKANNLVQMRRSAW